MTDAERQQRRERKRQRERRAAVLAAVGLFAVVLVVLVVQSARGADDPPPPPPPPTLRGKTIEQWAALADQRLARLAERERQLRRAHRHVERLRQAMRARVSLAGAGSGTRGLLCIHQYEGAWNDDGAPYWGGLQFDRDFMATYGASFYRALGTADHWPPYVQLAVGLAGYLDRGFSPWPNTRRPCGV